MTCKQHDLLDLVRVRGIKGIRAAELQDILDIGQAALWRRLNWLRCKGMIEVRGFTSKARWFVCESVL